jgi:hypothetical protein
MTMSIIELIHQIVNEARAEVGSGGTVLERRGGVLGVRV